MKSGPTIETALPAIRRHGNVILAMIAIAGLVGSFRTHAADWDGGGLPPSIAKARPSAAVPADLPGNRVDPCAVFGAVSLYQPIGRGTFVNVSPQAVLSADGQTCSGGGSPARASDVRPASPEGGSLPFADGESVPDE